MPNSPVIIAIEPGGFGQTHGGVAYAPTEFECTYRIRNQITGADLGGLRGVLTDPVFQASLNAGSASLTLNLDHYPSELTYGNLVDVRYPDGTVAGTWRYEGVTTSTGDTTAYQILLLPLISEAADCPLDANYSSDASLPNPPLGATGFDVPVRAGLAQTMHLQPTDLNSDAVAYAYSYQNARVLDALNQAIKFGGAAWWWHCDHHGRVFLRNSARYTHTLNTGREIATAEWAEDITSLYNMQTVTGATPASGTTALSATAVDDNPASPYSTVNLGKRAAPTYSDTSLLDQASVDAMATSLLAYAERVTRHRVIHVTGYDVTRRPEPGDAVVMRISEPDPSAGDVSIVGPFLITDVTEYGATRSYDITVSADMTVPVAARRPTLWQDQALRSLMNNPPLLGVSPDGSTGNISPGAIAGSGVTAPSVPTGLYVSTGLDNVAQTNNGYALVSWSIDPGEQYIAQYEVRYQKAGDAAWTYVHTTQVQTKISGLVPGETYLFAVRAATTLNNYGDWTTSVSATITLDTAAPAVPTGVKAYRTPRGALVSWNGNTEPDLQGYLLQVSIAGADWTTVNDAPSLQNSAVYTAPSGVQQQTELLFRVAALDWTGNQSPWSSPSQATVSDGVVISELMTGNLTAMGTITGGGGFQTSSTGGRHVAIDNAGIRLYDGSSTEWDSMHPGVVGNWDTATGSAFFKGTVAASLVRGTSLTPPTTVLDLASTNQLYVLDAGSPAVKRVSVGTIDVGDGGGYGVIVKDATGNVIMDSTGLRMVASNLKHISTDTTPAAFPYTTTFAYLTGTDAPFSLGRQQNVLMMSNATFYVNPDGLATNSDFAYIRLALLSGGTVLQTSNKVAVTDAPVVPPSGSGHVPQMGHAALYIYATLAAGSYDVQLQYSFDTTGTTGQFVLYGGYTVDVFQMGG